MEEILKHTFGLDIRDNALTAVELEMDKKSFKVINYSRVELERGIVEEDSFVLNPEAFKEAVAKLLQKGSKGPITSRDVIISIPDEKTFFHYLSIPVEQAEHTKWILGYAKDYIPIDLSEAAIDYQCLKNSGEKEVTLDFVAIQKSLAESLIGVLGDAGLKVVAIDARKNSIMRACDPFWEKGKNSLFIYIDKEYTSLTLRDPCGISHILNLNKGENQLFNAIKSDLKIGTVSEIKTILSDLKKAPAKNENSLKIKNILEAFFQEIIKKAGEFYKMTESEDALKIDTLYALQFSAEWPGLTETLGKAFPGTEVIGQFEQVKIDDQPQSFYFNAIGLAMRAVLPKANSQSINLLPYTKKEELGAEELRPKLLVGLLAMSVLCAAATVFLGIKTAKAYLDYAASIQEVKISTEEIQNPYLNQAAQATQQKTQLESQISSLVMDAIPAGWIIQKIDTYNVDGIAMVNVGYYLDVTGKMNVQIRAKTDSRMETEKFVTTLENDVYFSEVISPLSNLVGKGERFIQMDLVLDKEKINELSLEEEQKAAAPEEGLEEEAPADTDTIPADEETASAEAGAETEASDEESTAEEAPAEGEAANEAETQPSESSGADETINPET